MVFFCAAFMLVLFFTVVIHVICSKS